MQQKPTETKQSIAHLEEKAILKWYHIIPGVLFCLAIAVVAFFLAKIKPIDLVGGPVLAILIGIIITTAFPKLMSHTFVHSKFGKLNFAGGTKYTSKKLLQYSIILLGFGLSVNSIIKSGTQSLIVMVFTLTAAFVTALIMGKLLKLTANTTTLIGVGTSICGGSAIAATAPVIHASDEDVAHSISTIFLFNIIAVFLFPFLGHLMHMTDQSFGVWAGTAINDTSSVVAAGASFSLPALKIATVVKLTRTLMIVPITLFLAVYSARKHKKSGKSDFNFAKVFPWFVIFFLVAALINSFIFPELIKNIGGFPKNIGTILSSWGKFLIIMAMAAIGLSTNLKKLVSNGIKPIVLGTCCWFAVAVVSLIIEKLMGI